MKIFQQRNIPLKSMIERVVPFSGVEMQDARIVVLQRQDFFLPRVVIVNLPFDRKMRSRKECKKKTASDNLDPFLEVIHTCLANYDIRLPIIRLYHSLTRDI